MEFKVLIPSAKQMKDESSNFLFYEKKEIFNEEKNEYEIKKYEIESKIIEKLAEYNEEELAKIYECSEEIAKKEHENIVNIKEKKAKYKKAIELYNGMMYKNIDYLNLKEEEKRYINENVEITTSMYGIIKSDFYIAKHRLDFMQNININVFTDKSIKESVSLKKYFNSEYNKYADEILNVKKLQIISLLSSEFEEVFSKKYRDQFIKIGFAEEKYDKKEGKIKIKTHSTISKKARGLFVKYLSENKIKRVSDLLNNDINIYGFMLSKEYSDIELDEKNGIKKVKKIMYIKKY